MRLPHRIQPGSPCVLLYRMQINSNACCSLEFSPTAERVAQLNAGRQSLQQSRDPIQQFLQRALIGLHHGKAGVGYLFRSLGLVDQSPNGCGQSG